MVPNCLHTTFHKIESIRGFNIVYCENCEVFITLELFTNNIQTASCACTEKDYIDYANDYLPARLISYNKVIPLLESYRRTNYILDIGSNYGHFLTLAKEHRWHAEGVEVSHVHADIARKKMGHIIYENIEDDTLRKEKYDVITLWDVIEHIHNTDRLLCRIKELLRPGGLVLVKTPDARIFNRKYEPLRDIAMHFYRSYVYPSNPRQHVYHFTPDNLVDALARRGFVNCKVDTKETFRERVVPGNNRFVRFARFFLLYITWQLEWPFEFVLTCEKNTKENSLYT